MYEAEVNSTIEGIESLPAEIRQRFAESRESIRTRTTLPWGEHCTECNWPTCYTSCELYTPRTDGACRLFIDGMVRIDHQDSVAGYVLKIRFKRWGKLWTVGNLNLLSVAQAENRERRNMFTGAVARSLPLFKSAKVKVLKRVAYRRKQEAIAAPPSGEQPDFFLLECYNPNPRTIGITFTAKLTEQPAVAYQRMITAPPGFTRERIPFSEISRRLDTSQPFDLELIPNESEDTILYFGLLDFVREKPQRAVTDATKGENKWKCIVWDLDNTLWNGTLVEDGPAGVRIKEGVIDVIKETDRRGILHSIASKNNHDDAVAVLRTHGIEEYFLYPQINWQPKSQSVNRIAQLLNIGQDTLLFVDDQPFERAEVTAAHPDVTAIDAVDFGTIPGSPRCRVPITDESRQRREMYRQQEQRTAILESYAGDYSRFLRECDIRLEIGSLSNENIERVYELAQRTNQMNFSGNRYQRAELAELMIEKSRQSYVIKCTDRFGSYGIVGFAIVDVVEPRLLDLMFSCRIQSKRVEHSFLSFLLKQFIASETRDFFVNYRKSPKNAPSGRVFEEMGFDQVDEKDGLSSLVFPGGRNIPDDGIIRISSDVTVHTRGTHAHTSMKSTS